MSKIQWTDETWNPVTGCEYASPGCKNCYAVMMTKRLEAMGQEKYEGLLGKAHFNGVVKTHDDALTIPLRWKKPRMVFVNSMSDLFHPSVPFEFINKVWTVMIVARQHTFQILTKRPDRMAQFFAEKRYPWSAGERTDGVSPNIWLGTSVENQEMLDLRVPHLLKCPAAIRFLSCEPLLEPLKLTLIREPWMGKENALNCLNGYVYGQRCDDPRYRPGSHPHIDWVIGGCESGNKRRSVSDFAFSSMISQCQSAGVSYFQKQMEVDGKVTGDIDLFPEWARVRQYPEDSR